MVTRVLFVEDEADLRDIVVEALGVAGYEVTIATDGQEAIERLSSREYYSVVVTDVNMPGGISGLEVAAQAATLQPHARVIVASGYQKAQLPPIPDSVRFLSKPYRYRQLLAAIREELPG